MTDIPRKLRADWPVDRVRREEKSTLPWDVIGVRALRKWPPLITIYAMKLLPVLLTGIRFVLAWQAAENEMQNELLRRSISACKWIFATDSHGMSNFLVLQFENTAPKWTNDRTLILGIEEFHLEMSDGFKNPRVFPLCLMYFPICLLRNV